MKRRGFELTAIGVVHVDFDDDYIRAHPGEVEGVVEVFPEYSRGLEGIEEYSHLFLFSFLDRVSEEDRRLLTIKPRRLLRLGFSPEQLPTIGVFASDSPVRPNPIGLTLVRLIAREGNMLRVYGLDLFNGTPILDIKPFRSDYMARNFKAPEWVAKHDTKPPV